MSAFIDALRETPPQTEVFAINPRGASYRFTTRAGHLIKEWDALQKERDQWAAEAKRLNRLVTKLTGQIVNQEVPF